MSTPQRILLSLNKIKRKGLAFSLRVMPQDIITNYSMLLIETITLKQIALLVQGVVDGEL